jgi:hypothetical protein
VFGVTEQTFESIALGANAGDYDAVEFLGPYQEY